MVSKEKIELSANKAALEQQYKIIKIGLLWGWIPFFLIAFYVLNHTGLVVIALFFILMLTFLSYYGFLFNKIFKVSGELSRAKVKLDVESL